MSNSISLSKNQSISLKKPDGSSLKKVFMGLSWKEGSPKVIKDVVKPSFIGKMFGQKEQEVERTEKVNPIDLDSSVVCFDASGNKVDTVWFRQYEGLNGAIQHMGDNRSGGTGVGDDERINIDLSRVPKDVSTLVFTVNSFTGQTFESVEMARCRLVDAETNEEKASIDLTASGKHKGVIMAKLYRVGSEWEIKSIAELGGGDSRTIEGLMPQIMRHI